MPITLPDTSFSQVLNPEDTNRADTRAFLSSDVEPFTLPGFVTPFGYVLWQNRAERQFRLITQGPEPETAYAVRLEETEDFTSPERACIQVMVWRTRQPQHEGGGARPGAPVLLPFSASLVDYYYRQRADERGKGDVGGDGGLGAA